MWLLESDDFGFCPSLGASSCGTLRGRAASPLTLYHRTHSVEWSEGYLTSSEGFITQEAGGGAVSMW